MWAGPKIRSGGVDPSLEYPHEDTEYFDAKKWTSPEHRLVQWGGPVAEMLVANSLRPFLNQLFKGEAMEARARMKLFLESMINQAFAPPAAIRLAWSNTNFHDSKTQADLLKFGLTTGPLSLNLVAVLLRSDSSALSPPQPTPGQPPDGSSQTTTLRLGEPIRVVL